MISEVAPEYRYILQPGLPGNLGDGQTGRLEHPPGQDDALHDQPAVRRGTRCGDEFR